MTFLLCQLHGCNVTVFILMVFKSGVFKSGIHAGRIKIKNIAFVPLNSEIIRRAVFCYVFVGILNYFLGSTCPQYSQT